MGAYSFINVECILNTNVELGRYVMLGPRVAIVGGDHVFDVPGVPTVFSGRGTIGKTKIEDDVWLGYGVIVMSGIRVGRGAIVAAGSVVTKDIPPYEIHAGVPNKKIRDRFDAEQIAIHEKMLEEGIYVGKLCEAKQIQIDE